MSSGHLSRQFRLAYGESPYSYLMTRRIERAMALLRRGDLSVTEVCFAVGCASLGTFSTRFTELVACRPAPTSATRSRRRRAYRRASRNRSPDRSGIEKRRSPSRTYRDGHGHHHSPDLPPTGRSGRRAGLLSRHPRFRGPQRRRIQRTAVDHRWPRRPARHLHRPAPACRRPRGHRRGTPDHRRDDGEAPTPPSTWRPRTSTAPSRSCRPATSKWCRSRPTSRTGSATAHSATPRATWSASKSCAEFEQVDRRRP